MQLKSKSELPGVRPHIDQQEPPPPVGGVRRELSLARREAAKFHDAPGDPPAQLRGCVLRKLDLAKQSVFFDMGQGFIAGNFTALTSELWSCLVVAGSNPRTGLCGAYHYPACGRNTPEVRRDLADWIGALHPDDVIVIQPRSACSTEPEARDRQADLDFVRASLAEGVVAKVASIHRPFVRNVGGRLEVGDADDKGWDAADVTLSERPAGFYRDRKERPLSLFGRDLMTSQR